MFDTTEYILVHQGQNIGTLYYTSFRFVLLFSFPSCRQFGGFANSQRWIDEALKFGETVERLKIPVREDFYFTAGYDAPFKVFNRRNEVWFVRS